MEHKKKLKEKLHEIKTLNCSSSEPDRTSKEKKMQLEGKRKGVVKKPKSLKSKGKKASANSEKSQSNARKRTRLTDLYDGDIEAQFNLKERTDKVLSCLENEIPFFLKCMLPSNVAHGFWLHLPAKFCSIHLPNHDTSIVLVDEWGNEYKTSYLIDRHGLSAGWRGFSISHRLLKGDILIFHLTEPSKLKVHIVRVNGSDVVDAALCLMDLDASARGTNSDVKKDNRKRRKREFVDPFSTPLEKVKGKDATNCIGAPVAHQSGNNSDGFSSEVLEGSEIANQPQTNDIRYPETSFLHDHSREVVTCR